MAAAAESIRTLFGSSGRRRLTCSRCKEFSTTNQAIYSAHLRDCAGAGSGSITNLSSSPSQQQATSSASPASTSGGGGGGLIWQQSNDNNRAQQFVNNNNPPGAHGANNWLADWQQLVYQSAKQLQAAQQQQQSVSINNAHNQQQQQQHSLLTLASAAMAADAVAAFAKSKNVASPSAPPPAPPAPVQNTPAPTQNQQPAPPPLSLLEESGSGERYGFREVFKHMYQAMVNGGMAYCCRLCPYQHAVRSRVTKHIRLQHFSKQALSMFTCELCSFTTQHATELEHHRRRHAVNTKVYKCNECEYSTPMQNNFKRHLRRHTSSDAFVCSFCSFSSPHEATVKRHAFLYHRKTTTANGEMAPDNKQAAQAANQDDFLEFEIDDVDDNNSSCSLKQNNKSGSKKTVIAMDVDSGDKASESGRSCSNQSSTSVGNNNGNNNFICDVCSLVFHSLGSFSQHRAQHEPAAVSDSNNNNSSSGGGSMPLDLRCSSSTSGQQISNTDESGILNLSTKMAGQISSNYSAEPSPSPNRQNLRKQSAVKRHLSPASNNNNSTCNKLLKLENNTAKSDSNEIAGGGGGIFERRYGCPICSFEADDKAVVRQHVSENHPASVTSRKGGTGRMNAAAIGQTSAMLPIRCLSVPSRKNSAAKSAAPEQASAPALPLLIKCGGENRENNNNNNSASSSPSPSNLVAINTISNNQQDESPENNGANSTPGYQCNRCNYRTSSQANYEKHIAYHEDLKVLKCSSCGYRCNWLWEMNKHCRTVHNASSAHMIVLPLEEARSTLADYLQRSSPTSASVSSSSVSPSFALMKMFRCSNCSFSSRRRKMVERHQRQSHRQLSTDKLSNSLTVLEVTNDLDQQLSNEFPAVSGLPTPPASHGTPSTSASTGSHSSPPLPPQQQVRLFKCSICGLGSTWKKSIKSHLTTQHPGSSVTGRILVGLVDKKQQKTASKISPRTSLSLRGKSNCRRYKCPFCFYRANFYHDVKKHARNVHQADVEVVVLDEEFAKRTLADYVIRFANSRRSVGSNKSVRQSNNFCSKNVAKSQHSQSVFNCRKCNFHTNRHASFLAHSTCHFINHQSVEICGQCGFSASTLLLAEEHQLLWHTEITSSKTNSCKIEQKDAVKEEEQKVQSIGYKCTVCNLEMPTADEAMIREHVSSLHVPPALLALGAVRLDALFVPLS